MPISRAPQRGSLRLALVLAVLVGVNLYVFLWRGGTSIPDVMDRAAVAGEELPAAGGEPSTGELVPASGQGAIAALLSASRAEMATATAAETAEADESDEAEGDAESDSWTEGEVLKNDNMAGILEREELDSSQAGQLIAALTPHIDFRKLHVGQTYRIHRDAGGQYDQFEFHTTRVTRVTATRAASGTIDVKTVKAETEVRNVEVGGTIDSSLYNSIKDLGEDSRLVAFLVEVFAYDLNFYVDQHKGDAFRMIVEKEYLEGEFLRYGRVLAAEWSGKAGTFRAFSWHVPGASRPEYYDEQGRSVAKTFLKSPLKYTRISSSFNPRRMHPVLHRVKGHHGVDYAAPTGTPVWAAASGKITFRGRRGGAGNAVIVAHANGLSTIYMHLSKFQKGQKVGQRVPQKTVIGYVGMTGLATGPHLHFGVKKNGHYIDPMKMKMARSNPVPSKFRAQFEADTARLVQHLAAIPTAPGGAVNSGGPSPAALVPNMAPSP